MSFLSKKDEKAFYDLLSNSELVIDDIFENIIDINVNRQYVIENLKKQQKEILSEIEKCPDLIFKL